MNPKMQLNAPKASHLKSESQVDTTLEGLGETHRALWENILEAQRRQTKYASGKQITFDIGDKMCLLTEHFHTTRWFKKLE